MPIDMPTIDWGGDRAAIPRGAINFFRLTDNPLVGNDKLTLSVAASALPAALPAFVRVSGFGDFYLTKQTTSASEPGLVSFDASKRDNRGAALAKTILDFLQGNGIDAITLLRTPAFRRWAILATRSPVRGRTDRQGIQWLIAQQILGKGATPNLDTLRRGLIERGLTLLEGDYADYAVPNTGLSVVPLEFNRNGDDADGNEIVKALPARTAIDDHQQPLWDALETRIEFNARGEALAGGAAADSEVAFTAHIGNFDRVNYGVIALEMRRYVALQTSERARAVIPFDATIRIGDIVSDSQRREWRVASAHHTLDMNGGKYETRLALARRHKPTEAQIRAGSPPPFDTSAPRLETLPNPPSIAALTSSAYYDPPLELADVGGAALISLTPSDSRGKPIRQLELEVQHAVPTPVHKYHFDHDGFNPVLDLRIFDLRGGIEYTFGARAHNEFGASEYARATFTPTALPPVLGNPVLLTGGDAYALHDPDGMVGGAVSKAIEQRIGASVRPYTDPDDRTQALLDIPHSIGQSQTFIIGNTGQEAISNTAIASRLDPFLSVFGITLIPRTRSEVIYALVNLNPRGTRYTGVEAQYRTGAASAPASDADIAWDSWQDWRVDASPPPRGTSQSPNPEPLNAADDATSDTAWQFILRIDEQGIGGTTGLTGVQRPYLATRFRAVSRDADGNRVGDAGAWVTLNTIDMRQWGGGATGYPRHYSNAGILLYEYSADGSNALAFLPASV